MNPSIKFEIKRWDGYSGRAEPHLITDARIKYKQITGKDLPNKSKIVFRLLQSEYYFKEKGEGYVDKNIYQIEIFEGFYEGEEKNDKRGG